MLNRRSLIGFFFVILVSMVFVDRMSKEWAAANLQAGVAGYTFGPINLTLVHNTGAAFGMGSGNTWLFSIIAIVIVAAIIFWLFRSKGLNIYEVVGFGLIAAGGLGNLIDRMTIGYVVDFIQFNFIDFPVFNVADMCVTVGVALVIASAFAKIRSDQQEILVELEEKSAAERKRRMEARQAKEDELLRQVRDKAIEYDEELDPDWGDDEEWERAERARLDSLGGPGA